MLSWSPLRTSCGPAETKTCCAVNKLGSGGTELVGLSFDLKRCNWSSWNVSFSSFVWVTCAAACGWCVCLRAAIRLPGTFRGCRVVGSAPKFKEVKRCFWSFESSCSPWGLKIVTGCRFLPERLQISSKLFWTAGQSWDLPFFCGEKSFYVKQFAEWFVTTVWRSVHAWWRYTFTPVNAPLYVTFI